MNFIEPYEFTSATLKVALAFLAMSTACTPSTFEEMDPWTLSHEAMGNDAVITTPDSHCAGKGDGWYCDDALEKTVLCCGEGVKASKTCGDACFINFSGRHDFCAEHDATAPYHDCDFKLIAPSERGPDEPASTCDQAYYVPANTRHKDTPFPDFEGYTVGNYTHQGNDYFINDVGKDGCEDVGVYAPVDCNVTHVENNQPDRSIDYEDEVSCRTTTSLCTAGTKGLGNRVDCVDAYGVTHILAHMRPGSIVVQKDTMIKAGTYIGKISDSGTTQTNNPNRSCHLHYETHDANGTPFDNLDCSNGLPASSICGEEGCDPIKDPPQKQFPAPELLAPQNGHERSSSSPPPLLEWSPPAGATTCRVVGTSLPAHADDIIAGLEGAEGCDERNVCLFQKKLSSTNISSFQPSSSSVPEDKNIHWFVRCAAPSQDGEWSEIWRFRLNSGDLDPCAGIQCGDCEACEQGVCKDDTSLPGCNATSGESCTVEGGQYCYDESRLGVCERGMIRPISRCAGGCTENSAGTNDECGGNGLSCRLLQAEDTDGTYRQLSYPFSQRMACHDDPDGHAARASPVLARNWDLDCTTAGAENLLAPIDGIIEKVVDGGTGNTSGYGNQVCILSAAGETVCLNHMHTIVAEEGCAVQKGQVLGTCGSTGISSGPHLDIFMKDSQGDPIELAAPVTWSFPDSEIPWSCDNTSTCINGPGDYCGDENGNDTTNLYTCSNGTYSLKEQCNDGCVSAPAGQHDYCATTPMPGSCPSGNGDYCGDESGNNADSLYTCTNGSYSLKEQCAHNCVSAPPGQNDYCGMAPASCPGGNGDYCGDENGNNAGSLYTCNNGTYSLKESCAHGCVSAPSGQNDYCGMAPTLCPSGNGDYCGDENGSDTANLYSCLNGSYNLKQQCSNGCVSAPSGQNDYCAAPPASCPGGNGDYCGDENGNNSGSLYTCTNGTYSLKQQCAHGCVSAPAGQNDYCGMAPASCPGGDGDYCGDENGNDTTSLYTCTNGTYSLKQQCAHGCIAAPSGQNDYCDSPPASCPGGNGDYCGDENGNNAGALYTCTNGAYSLKQQCAHGCITAPSGQNDYCDSAPASCPGGNGDYCGDENGNNSGSLYTCFNGTYSLKEQCAHGCVSAPAGQNDYCGMAPAECTSGPCCSPSGTYRPSTFPCDLETDQRYVCPDGESAGDDVYVEIEDRYCSGASAFCNGDYRWGGPFSHESCSSNEACVQGQSSCQPVAPVCTDVCQSDTPAYRSPTSSEVAQPNGGEVIRLTLTDSSDCQRLKLRADKTSGSLGAGTYFLRVGTCKEFNGSIRETVTLNGSAAYIDFETDYRGSVGQDKLFCVTKREPAAPNDVEDAWFYSNVALLEKVEVCN